MKNILIAAKCALTLGVLMILGCGQTGPSRSETDEAVGAFVKAGKKKPSLNLPIMYGTFSAFQSGIDCEAQAPPYEVQFIKTHEYDRVGLVSIDRVNCQDWRVDLTQMAKTDETANNRLDVPNKAGHTVIELAKFAGYELGDFVPDKDPAQVRVDLIFKLTDSGKTLASHLGSLPVGKCSITGSGGEVKCRTICQLMKTGQGWRVARETADDASK